TRSKGSAALPSSASSISVGSERSTAAPSSSTVTPAASRAARKNSPALPIAAFSPGPRARLLAAATVISVAPSATPSAEFAQEASSCAIRMIAEGPAASAGVATGFDGRALARPGACDFGRDADGILTSLGPTLRRAAPDHDRLLPPVVADRFYRGGPC